MIISLTFAALAGVCALAASPPSIAPVPPGASLGATLPAETSRHPDGGPPSPQDVRTWRLADFEALARQYNPTLVMAEARIQAARGAHIQSKAWPNPTVGYLGDEIGDEDAAGLQGVTWTASIPNPWQRQALIDSSAWELKREFWLYEVQRLRVLGEVRSRFHAAYVAQERVEVSRRIFDNLSRIVALTHERFAKQEISRGEVLQAQTSRDLAAITLETEIARAEAAWQSLILVTGMQDIPKGRLAMDLPREELPPDWAGLAQSVVARNPEYLAAKARVEAARAQLRSQLRARIPQVDLETIVKHHNTNGFNSVTVGVSIPVPVFDQNRGNILAAEGALREAEADLRRIELQLHQRLAALRAEYQAAVTAAATYRRSIIPHQKEAVALLEEAYRKGEVHLVELLQAENALNDAELQYWTAMETLLRVQAELEVLLVGTEAGLGWDR